MADPAIEALRDAEGCLDRAAVQSILPYGDDFLFVDQVTGLTEDEIQASHLIDPTSPFLRSHFRGLPLMPGVLVGEGMAQAGTLLVRYRLDQPGDKDILAFQIEGARFSSPAQPGDRLDYRVRLLNLRRRVARLEGEAHVGQREICRARIVLGIVERTELSAQLAELRES